MKAVILAAGKGTRMRDLTLSTPKPLLRVAGIPIIEHMVRQFPDAVDELVIVVGYLGDQIREYCSTKFLGRPVSYVDQPQALGTFHSLSLCQKLLKGSGRFLAFYSDDIIDRATIEKSLTYEQAAVVGESEHPEKYGVVTLNPDGSIADIVEKPSVPTSNLVMATGFVFTEHIFSYRPKPHPNSGEEFLSTAIAAMAKNHSVMAVKANAWVSIGAPEDIAKAEIALKELEN